MKFFSDGMYWWYDSKTQTFCHPTQNVVFFSLNKVKRNAEFSPPWREFLENFKKAQLKNKLYDQERNKD